MTRTKTLTKEQALIKYLGENAGIIEQSKYDDCLFTTHSMEYLVLTDDEAQERCEDDINNNLWAFNADFIAGHTRTILSSQAIQAISEMQSKLCEDANEVVRALIYDIDHFVEDAINADGRGHFLASYDFEENQEGDYYIYRVN